MLANSLGFLGSYRFSSCSIAAVPLAEQNGTKQRDFWYSVARSMAKLDEPEKVGQEAARRALRRLGARKVKTSQVPIVFDPETARSLVGHLFEAARGDAIYRSASFLTGKLGKQLAPHYISLLDDALRPGGFGSRPFDDEGVTSRVTPLVEKENSPTIFSTVTAHGSSGCRPRPMLAAGCPVPRSSARTTSTWSRERPRPKTSSARLRTVFM